MFVRSLKLVIKKTLRYAERDHMSRIKYIRSLRAVIKNRGAKDVIFVDESGFEAHTYRPYAWSTKGCKSFGERSGKRGGRTNLIAGKRGKDLLATVLYETSTTADWFNEWFENHLLKELNPASTIIMDNAAFHKKSIIIEIAKKAGHHVLFLPPYSPDFNPIEQVFATLKKNRMHQDKKLTIDDTVREYGLFLE